MSDDLQLTVGMLVFFSPIIFLIIMLAIIGDPKTPGLIDLLRKKKK